MVRERYHLRRRLIARGCAQPSAGGGAVRRAPALATTTSRDRDQLQRREVLAERDEADRRRDRRLEAHQDPERAARQAPQRLELERVGDRRAQHRDREPDREEPEIEQVRAARRDPRHEDQRAGDHHRERQPLPAGERAPDPRREHDVGGPEPAGDQRQDDPEQVEVAAGRGGEEHDPGAGEQRPHQVEPAAEEAIATPSGPMNSKVTAIPSGIRSSAR